MGLAFAEELRSSMTAEEKLNQVGSHERQKYQPFREKESNENSQSSEEKSVLSEM